jgi:hypothetical protein
MMAENENPSDCGQFFICISEYFGYLLITFGVRLIETGVASCDCAPTYSLSLETRELSLSS